MVSPCRRNPAPTLNNRPRIELFSKWVDQRAIVSPPPDKHGQRIAKPHQRPVRDLADCQQQSDSGHPDEPGAPGAHEEVHQQQPGQEFRQRRRGQRQTGEAALANRSGEQEQRQAEKAKPVARRRPCAARSRTAAAPRSTRPPRAPAAARASRWLHRPRSVGPQTQRPPRRRAAPPMWHTWPARRDLLQIPAPAARDRTPETPRPRTAGRRSARSAGRG